MHRLVLILGLLWLMIFLVVGIVLIAAPGQNAAIETAEIERPVFAVDADLVQESPDHAFDVVFAADTHTYDGLTDKQSQQRFRQDVRDAIEKGIFRNSVFGNNRSLFSFWLVLTPGAVNGPECPREVVWPTHAIPRWADAVVLLHDFAAVTSTKTHYRDCTTLDLRYSTAERGGDYPALVHELGHALFRLPDEYSKWGGYWHRPDSLYKSAEPLGVAAQKPIVSTNPLFEGTYWRGETEPDIMGVTQVDYVPQFGEKDWEIIRDMLVALPQATVVPPDCFGLSKWTP